MSERDEYEFTGSQDIVFRKVAFNLRLVSIALIIIGVTTILLALIPTFNFLALLDGLTWLVMGIVFFLPIDSFLMITTSEGKDIKVLMSGLNELDKGWIIVIIVLSINKIVEFINFLKQINSF